MFALLQLTDVVIDGNPQIDMRVVYEGAEGFRADSNAHQHMKILIQMMDFIAEKRVQSGDVILDSANFPETMKQALESIEAQSRDNKQVIESVNGQPH